MARWEPNARGRLSEAAMALFSERGYDRTTVEDIAARAGLTERTFFRYFTDKREVLFSASADLQRLIVGGIAAAPAATPPLEAVVAALELVAAALEPRRKHSIARYALIVAHAELREREQMKLTSLAAAVADALRARGVADPAASLTSEAGIAIFKVGFERWIEDARPHPLKHHIRVALDELKTVVAAAGSSPAGSRTARPSRRRRVAS